MSTLRLILQTLLLLVCACADDVEPTVLRFYVYSDLPLSSVRASVLGGDAVITKQIDVDAGIPSGDLLFWIAVEVTPESKNRQTALVRFDGTPATSSQNVLSQIVSASFVDQQTRIVRVRLAAVCAHRTNDAWCAQTCNGEDGSCGPAQVLTSEPVDSMRDLSSWEPRVERSCDCPYPRCNGDACVSTVTVPPLEIVLGKSDFASGFMRRVDVPGELVAIGVLAASAGERFQLYVAEDTGQGPGALQESGTATAKLAGEDFRAELPLSLGFARKSLWIGLQPTGGSAAVSVMASPASSDDQLLVTGVIPAKGGRFLAGSTEPYDGPAPAVYAVFYP